MGYAALLEAGYMNDLATPELEYTTTRVEEPDRIMCGMANVSDDRLTQVCEALGFLLLDATVYEFESGDYKIRSDYDTDAGTYIFVRMSGNGQLMIDDYLLSGTGWMCTTVQHWSHRFVYHDMQPSVWLVMHVKQQ